MTQPALPLLSRANVSGHRRALTTSENTTSYSDNMDQLWQGHPLVFNSTKPDDHGSAADVLTMIGIVLDQVVIGLALSHLMAEWQAGTEAVVAPFPHKPPLVEQTLVCKRSLTTLSRSF